MNANISPAIRPLLTIKQVSEYLAIPESTLYKKIGTQHCPPARKIGGTLRFRMEDVDAWLDTKLDDNR